MGLMALAGLMGMVVDNRSLPLRILLLGDCVKLRGGKLIG